MKNALRVALFSAVVVALAELLWRALHSLTSLL